MKTILFCIFLCFFIGCTITHHDLTVNEYPCDGDSSKIVKYNNNFIINRDTIKPNLKRK